MARASATGESSSKWAGTRRSSSVFGPRPSSLRAAAETAASPTAPAPSITSPLIAPSEGKRTWRPSGPTPTQFIPVPQVTAMPQPRSVPARRTAKVSLPDDDLGRPAPLLRLGLVGLLLVGKVETGDQEDGEVGRRVPTSAANGSSASTLASTPM